MFSGYAADISQKEATKAYLSTAARTGFWHLQEYFYIFCNIFKPFRSFSHLPTLAIYMSINLLHINSVR